METTVLVGHQAGGLQRRDEVDIRRLHLRFDTAGVRRCEAVLHVPPGRGPFPVILAPTPHAPGPGDGPALWHAAHGALVLSVPVRRGPHAAARWARQLVDTARRLPGASGRIGLRLLGHPSTPSALPPWARRGLCGAVVLSDTTAAAAPALRPTGVPTLYVSGWWDRGAAARVAAFMAAGGAAAGHRLLVGPWDHTGRAPLLDGLASHERALVERAAQRAVWNDELAWFGAVLHDGAAPRGGVEAFVTGAWCWIEVPDWPGPGRPPGPSDGLRVIADAYGDDPLGRPVLVLGDALCRWDGAGRPRPADVRLVDVAPDGRRFVVASGPLDPGRDGARLGPVAHLFRRGHRVVVESPSGAGGLVVLVPAVDRSRAGRLLGPDVAQWV